MTVIPALDRDKGSKDRLKVQAWSLPRHYSQCMGRSQPTEAEEGSGPMLTSKVSWLVSEGDRKRHRQSRGTQGH